VVVDWVQYKIIQDMKLAIHDFYKSLFTEPETWRSKVALYFSQWILIGRISPRRKSIKSLIPREKAPGPDGISITTAFLQSN